MRRRDRLKRRVWPDKPSQTSYRQPAFFIPVSLCSLTLDPPFPTFGSSPKHPRMSPVQSPNALPLHPIVCPTPLYAANPPPALKVLWG